MVPEATSPMEAQLENDVELAARTRVPVLISARPELALSIARTIATRSGRAGKTAMRVCDTAAGDDIRAALTSSRGGETGAKESAILLLREVHLLSRTDQAAVMAILDLRPLRSPDDTPRLIATSSVSLYERVRQGAFDAALFHRLNVIHIVPPGGT